MPHEFNGEVYKKASAHQKEWGNKIISEFNLNGDEHILDLGCGDGVLTVELAQLVLDGSVLGIDASQGMIEAARKLETVNLSFKVQDISNLDYENEFDLVFSNATLHWVKNHKLLLENLYSCLKKNGILRFNFAADGNCSRLIRIIHDAIQLPVYIKYFSKFDWPWYMPVLEEYEKLVLECPFKDVKIWGENADRYFPDVNSMVKWIDQPSLVPFLEVVPQEHKQSFRDYVVNRMIETTRQNDGRCFETFRRINVMARK
jgi:trans-aconitate 2-methyltransferase